MKICYFGDYDSEYARNRILIKGLRENKIEVVECNNKKNFWQKIFFLKKYKKDKDCDFILVGYSDRSRLLMVFLAKIFTKKLIVWDAFYSLYDSWVFDRKLVNKFSIKAYYYWTLDFLSCFLADKILLDTDEHIKYFVKIFKIKNNKFIKVLVGADDSVFYYR